MSRKQNGYSSLRKAATRNERRKFSRRNFLKTTLAGSAVAATAAPALGDGNSLPNQPRAGAQHDPTGFFGRDLRQVLHRPVGAAVPVHERHMHLVHRVLARSSSKLPAVNSGGSDLSGRRKGQ